MYPRGLIEKSECSQEAVDIPKPHLNPKVKLTESSSNKGQSYESSVSSSTSNRVSEVLFKLKKKSFVDYCSPFWNRFKFLSVFFQSVYWNT